MNSVCRLDPAMSPGWISPTARASSDSNAVITMAAGKPTSSAIAPRRAMSARRRTTPTARPASGPNSGPTTIAPTTVTGESVTTPIVASRVASTMKATNTPVSVESSPVRLASSSQISASAPSPGALSSASRTSLPRAVSSGSMVIMPASATLSACSDSRTSAAHSRARSAVTSRPSEVSQPRWIATTPSCWPSAPTTSSTSDCGQTIRRCSMLTASSASRLPRRHADCAVEADDLAVEHGVGHDLLDQRRVLARVAEAARVRHLLAQRVLRLLRQTLEHRRQEQPRCDGDDPDQLVGEVARDRQRHADDAALGGRVRSLSDLPLERGDRRGVDDDPALAVYRLGGQDPLGGQPDDVERADQVHADDPAELLERQHPVLAD